MTNGGPQKTMDPMAEGFLVMYYREANRTGTQTTATWTKDKWDGVPIPPDYKAELRVRLVYVGPHPDPRRRQEDLEGDYLQEGREND